MRCLIFLTLFAFILRGTDLSAQNSADTLRLTMPEADKMFLEKNLILLANRSNVDVAKALTEQAKLWDNPVVSTSNNLFAATDVKFFDTRQAYVQYMQLFRLGHKRDKLVDFQKENERLNEAQFNDLLRNLRYTLHNDFHRLTGDYMALQLLENETVTIKNLLDAMRPQVTQGNVTLKDLVRIETIEYGLEQDILTTRTDITAVQSEVKTLLQIATPTTQIKPVDVSNTEGVPKLDLDSLLAEVVRNRADLAAANSQTVLAQKNLIYQKSLATPDLSAGLEYDRGGSFANNVFNIDLSIPLPIYNRNQGNIKAAQIGIEQSKNLYQNAVAQAQNQVIAAFGKIQQLAPAVTGDQSTYFQNFNNLMSNVVKMYATRQISLLDFVDLFESYKDTRLRRIQTLQNFRLAKEELNFQVGRQVF